MMLDILEEHLEEASWIFDVRAHLLRSYHVTLTNLADWDERWLAHVDGLMIGEEAARPIVERVLVEGDEGSACAAAAVLACWGAAADRETIETLLEDAAGGKRDGVLLGLCLAPSSAHEPWLPAWTQSEVPFRRVAALEVQRFRGIVPPVEALRPLFRLRDQPPEVVRAAVALVGDLKIAGCNAWIEAAGEAPDAGVRHAALEAAVRAGVRGARERWRAAVKQGGSATAPGDLEKLGIYGAPEDLGHLVAALDRPDLAASALRGLGWLGHPGAAEPLLARMADPGAGRLAGHAFVTIFGVDLEAEGLSAVRADASAAANGAADEPLEIDPYEGLPSPDPQALARWWKANAARFPLTTRWRAGAAFSTAAPAATLRSGRLADRPAAAMDVVLAIREAPLLCTGDFAVRQRRWLDRHLGGGSGAARRPPGAESPAPGRPAALRG
jgi:uncharacterized protein (TIGR02270 family)